MAPIIGWEAAVSMLEQWAVLLEVVFGPVCIHPEVYKLSMLIEAVAEVSARLGEQARHQPMMSAGLVRLIHTEFRKIFRKVLTIDLAVR